MEQKVDLISQHQQNYIFISETVKNVANAV